MAGYIHCACETCFEITVGDPGELCSFCGDAGCAPEQECSVLPEMEEDDACVSDSQS